MVAFTPLIVGNPADGMVADGDAEEGLLVSPSSMKPRPLCPIAVPPKMT